LSKTDESLKNVGRRKTRATNPCPRRPKKLGNHGPATLGPAIPGGKRNRKLTTKKSHKTRLRRQYLKWKRKLCNVPPGKIVGLWAVVFQGGPKFPAGTEKQIFLRDASTEKRGKTTGRQVHPPKRVGKRGKVTCVLDTGKSRLQQDRGVERAKKNAQLAILLHKMGRRPWGEKKAGGNAKLKKSYLKGPVGNKNRIVTPRHGKREEGAQQMTQSRQSQPKRHLEKNVKITERNE